MITNDSKNILVADDSLFFRTKLSDILVEAGHRVKFARNGKEVIGEIQSSPEAIDLIILDLQMPDVDGFSVLKWINENGLRGKVPVLAISGVYELGGVMERLKDLGAAGLMNKGFTPEEIIFRVNRILFAGKARSATAVPRERVPVSIPVDFTIGDTTNTGYLLNISETGAFLHTKYELLVGSMLHLRFSLPGGERIFDLKGIVRWTTADVATKTLFGGGGIMFTTVPPEEQVLLKNFIAAELKRLGLKE